MGLHGLVMAAALLLAPLASAQGSEIFVCVDEFGNRTFTNVGDTARCKRLNVGPLTTVPAQPARPALGGSAGSGAQGQAPARPAANPGPSSFPRVESSAQRERDETRRTLLEAELKREEARLAELRAEYNNGEPERRGDERNYQKYLDRVQSLREQISRSESNVAELRRELGTQR